MAISHDHQVGDWRYHPSTVAAIVATACYLIAAIAGLFQYFKYRAWVWLVFVVAVIMELVGYGARVVATKKLPSTGPYIIQILLIILAPVLMAAGCYVIFGRIVLRVVPKQRLTTKIIWVPPRYLTPIFVTVDIVAFFVQGAGAAIVASLKDTDKNVKTKSNRGKAIILTGLIIQIAVFGFFTIIAVRFHFVGKRLVVPSDQLLMYAANGNSKRRLRPNWEHLLTAINGTCICILARSVYRVIEFAEGINGYAQTTEWTFYIFDFLPILLGVLALIIVHPGMYLPYFGFRQPKAIDIGANMQPVLA